jgi:hypothetical protein
VAGDSIGTSSASFSKLEPFRRAFFRRQYCPMVFVASSSQSGSQSRAINPMELKNFTALGFGFPNARSFPALTRMATSSVEQFRSLATCAASSRAGKSFAAQVAIAACIKSLLIFAGPELAHDFSSRVRLDSVTRTPANSVSVLTNAHETI